jgi:hypothetical protein
MFSTLLFIILGLTYLVSCLGLVFIPILFLIDNRDGDAIVVGSLCIITGICGLLLALAVFTGEITFDNSSDVPKQGCWYVSTTREMVGKTMQDVRHWESISCP